MAGHENLSSLSKIKFPSDKTFGLFFAGFFLVLTALGMHKTGTVRWWAVSLSAAFSCVTLIRPAALHPLNVSWMKLGHLLSKISSPIFLGVIFYLIFTPFALLWRAFHRDPLKLRWNPDVASYWIDRKSGALQPESLKNQF